MPAPPTQQSVGRIAGTGSVSGTRPEGAKTVIFGAGPATGTCKAAVRPARYAPVKPASRAFRLAAAVVVTVLMMPAVMVVPRKAAMIGVLEAVATMIEVTGLCGAHRKAECGGYCKCGQSLGEHLSLLS